jgi:hypothetical protein
VCLVVVGTLGMSFWDASEDRERSGCKVYK